MVHFATFVQVVVSSLHFLLRQRFPLRTGATEPEMGNFAELFADDLKFHADHAWELQNHSYYFIPNRAIFDTKVENKMTASAADLKDAHSRVAIAKGKVGGRRRVDIDKLMMHAFVCKV